MSAGLPKRSPNDNVLLLLNTFSVYIVETSLIRSSVTSELINSVMLLSSLEAKYKGEYTNSYIEKKLKCKMS